MSDVDWLKFALDLLAIVLSIRAFVIGNIPSKELIEVAEAVKIFAVVITFAADMFEKQFWRRPIASADRFQKASREFIRQAQSYLSLWFSFFLAGSGMTGASLITSFTSRR